MSKLTIHRNSSSLHIEKLHQKQLMKEMNEQCKQTCSLHISRQLSREMQIRLEVSQCVRDVMLKSCKKIKDEINKSRFNTIHQSKQNSPMLSRFAIKGDRSKKIQNKFVKFKHRVLQEEDGRSRVQRKLNEIVFIKNEGQIKKPDELIYSRVIEHSKEKFQIVFGENQIINKYWNQLQREAKLSRSALLKIKQNRVNMLIKQNLEPGQDMEQINQIKVKLNKKLAENNEELRRSADSLKKPSFLKRPNNRRVKYASLDTSTDATNIQVNHSLKNQSKKILLTKQVLQNSFIDYLKHKKQRKVFLNHLNKQLIQNDDAVKIYSFVKGGYSLDPYDIEGQFISLKRFNDAKESFSTLNELYKNIKSDCFYGLNSEIRDSHKENVERSFKSIVQINELNGKIAPNQLLKLMKQKKIVK